MNSPTGRTTEAAKVFADRLREALGNVADGLEDRPSEQRRMAAQEAMDDEEFEFWRSYWAGKD